MKKLVWDIVIIAGAVAVVAGVRMLSVPAGVIAGGVLAIAYGLLGASGGGPDDR